MEVKGTKVNLEKVAYKPFWDFRNNQFYFFDLKGEKGYWQTNHWYWDNKSMIWYKFLEDGRKIITKKDKFLEATGKFAMI